MTDPAAIAAGLTKAQREAVLKRVQSWGGALQGCTSWPDVGRPLLDAGLIAFASDPRSSETYWTPLGLAVRQHLHDAKVMREEGPAAADNSEAGDSR